MAQIIITVRDIAALIAYNPGVNDVSAVVQGYFYPGDGGGGTFIFKKFNDSDIGYMGHPPFPVPDSGIFIGTTSSSSGIWIRQFNGYIDIRFYGVFGVDNTNCTSKIQAAIDYASKCSSISAGRIYGYNKSNIIFIPNGSYSIGQFIMKSGVTLMGSSTEHTIINSIDDNNQYLIALEPGIVKNVHISGLFFIGNRQTYDPANPKYKGCFGFKAQFDLTDGAGGLWESSFKDITIIRFTGHSISFEGGGAATDYDYNLPNQFITFENVFTESVGDIAKTVSGFNNQYHALQLLGQNGQFSFTNCRFDGGAFDYTGEEPAYEVNGINVYIGPIAGTTINPAIITFNTCTFQLGENAFYIEGSNNIKIDGCWFESLERAIVIKGQNRSSKAISILNNSFLRSAGRYGSLDDNSGRIILCQNAHVNVHNNFVIDPDSDETSCFIALENQAGPNLGINGSGNYFEPSTGVGNPYVGNTIGLKKDFDTSALTTHENLTTSLNLIDIQASKTIFLNNFQLPTPPLTILNEIKSTSVGGEYVFFRANQGPIKFTQFYNLFLGAASVTINNGQCALFIKIDSELYNKTTPLGTIKTFYETYHLISIR